MISFIHRGMKKNRQSIRTGNCVISLVWVHCVYSLNILNESMYIVLALVTVELGNSDWVDRKLLLDCALFFLWPDFSIYSINLWTLAIVNCRKNSLLQVSMHNMQLNCSSKRRTFWFVFCRCINCKMCLLKAARA